MPCHAIPHHTIQQVAGSCTARRRHPVLQALSRSLARSLRPLLHVQLVDVAVLPDLRLRGRKFPQAAHDLQLLLAQRLNLLSVFSAPCWINV